MTRVRLFVVVALAASVLASAPSAAAPAETSGTLYSLITPPSSLQVGCQAPCECPIVLFPTFGSFQLVRIGADPLYTYYDVHGYIASFNNGPGAVAITGSGHYKIGGEFALVQELTLDLVIWGHPTEHFASGLVPVRVPFPRIDISCAVHGNYCYDSVLVVSAAPVEVTGLSSPARVASGLEAARPNPFTSRTSIAFTLERPGPVDLTIVDLEGRRVRALAAGMFAGAGRQSVSWDGRRDDGRVAPPGVYWVRMLWPGGEDRRRIVRLE